MSCVAFLTIDDIINHNCLKDVNFLEREEIFTRKAAAFVANADSLEGGERLRSNTAVVKSAIVLASFDRSCAVRGSLLVKIGSDGALFARAASANMTKAFITYVESTYTPENPETAFFTNFDFKNRRFTEVEKIVIPGDIFWVTPDEPLNWGMWVLQVLPALLLAEKHKIDATILCFAGSQWQKDFLAYFAPSYIGRIIYQDFNCEYVAERSLRTIVRTERNMVLTQFDKTKFDRLSSFTSFSHRGSGSNKIFVSRLSLSKKNPKYRVLLNEEVLINTILKLGYVIVEPETMTIPEQIATFFYANDIVGLGGAGMFNSAFSREGARITTLESSDKWIEAHANLFSSRGLRYGAVFGQQEADGEGDHRNWEVCVDSVIEAIRG